MPKTKTPAQLEEDIVESLGKSKGARRVHLGPGLMDGYGSAGANYRLREIRKLGATVKLAKTGRVTVRDAAGKVTVYTVDVPKNRAESDALLASNPDPDSPLTRALADLKK